MRCYAQASRRRERMAKPQQDAFDRDASVHCRTDEECTMKKAPLINPGAPVWPIPPIRSSHRHHRHESGQLPLQGLRGRKRHLLEPSDGQLQHTGHVTHPVRLRKDGEF
jgi:hypothetical protein